MNTRLQRWLPEIGLTALALFFALRELGTFPAAWEDDGLFMLTARTLADGGGYAIPILDHLWPYPYALGVGPLVILPSALSMKLLGFSIEAARVPQVFYLLGMIALFYLLAQKLTDTTAARWSTALLITLSAFVNTGKPVLGEVPGLFFLTLGMLCWQRTHSSRAWTIATGVAFGLAVQTKMTYALLFPALIVCACAALLTRDRRSCISTTHILMIALLVFLPWKLIEWTQGGDVGGFLHDLIISPEGKAGFYVLRENRALLLRFPYLYFGLLLVLGSTGIARTKNLPRHLRIFLISLIALFILYFLNREGWYRHLLPAHVFLLPFVPVGAFLLLPRTIGVPVLLLFAIAQGIWQFSYQGSPRGTEGAEAATYVEQNLATQNIIIQHAEVFVRLPRNIHWRFFPLPEFAASAPKAYASFTTEERCFPILRKLNSVERVAYAERITDVAGRYALLQPAKDCATREKPDVLHILPP